MNALERCCGAFAGAWELLLDLPLPEKMQELGRKMRHEARLAAVPWLGFLLGAALSLCSNVIGGAFHPVAGAVFFAVVLAAFLEFKELGRAPLLAANFLGVLIRSGSWERSAKSFATGDEDEVTPLSAGLVPLFFLLKAAAGYLLFRYGASLWAAAVLAGSFSLQAAVAVSVDPPLFRVKDEYRNRLWISFALVFFLLFLVHPLAAVAGACLVVFGSRWLIARWHAKTGSDGVTLAGVLTEWGMLAVGLLLALSRA